MSTIVSAADITTRFDALIAGSTSRETIEEWAFSCMKAQDTGGLSFAPPCDESRLWHAITYFSGVALRSSSDEYLHSQKDFVTFRQQLAL